MPIRSGSGFGQDFDQNPNAPPPDTGYQPPGTTFTDPNAGVTYNTPAPSSPGPTVDPNAGTGGGGGTPNYAGPTFQQPQAPPLSSGGAQPTSINYSPGAQGTNAFTPPALPSYLTNPVQTSVTAGAVPPPLNYIRQPFSNTAGATQPFAGYSSQQSNPGAQATTPIAGGFTPQQAYAAAAPSSDDDDQRRLYTMNRFSTQSRVGGDTGQDPMNPPGMLPRTLYDPTQQQPQYGTNTGAPSTVPVDQRGSSNTLPGGPWSYGPDSPFGNLPAPGTVVHGAYGDFVIPGGQQQQQQQAPSGAGGGMPEGIDPALAEIYRNAGINPSGRGSGFADWQYWQGVGPSQYDRLRRDLAGTGTDQPTGTPGQGPWMQSGRGQGGGGNSDALSRLFGRQPLPSYQMGGANVAGSPFSDTITGGLQQLIGAGGAPQSPYAQDIRNQVMNTIKSGGKLPADAYAQALERARSGFEAGRTGMVNQAMADIANRGLMPSAAGAGGGGALLSAEDMVSRSLAPQFAQSLEDYQVNQANLQNQNFMNALNQGVAGGERDTANMLQALNQSSQYQGMVSDIALKSLAQNQQWNEFLAQFGLNRDMVMYELAQGNDALINNLLNTWEGAGATTSGGHL